MMKNNWQLCTSLWDTKSLTFPQIWTIPLSRMISKGQKYSFHPPPPTPRLFTFQLKLSNKTFHSVNQNNCEGSTLHPHPNTVPFSPRSRWKVILYPTNPSLFQHPPWPPGLPFNPNHTPVPPNGPYPQPTKVTLPHRIWRRGGEIPAAGN